MLKVREIEKAPIDFVDVMNISQDAIMSRLNCHNIGKIIEYDSATQTCTVQMMIQKQFYKQTITPAPITNVPLIMYGTSAAQITLPNPVGSICLLMFLDRNADSFMRTGEMYVPETTRTHDFTDCVAITTFSTLNNPIQNYDNEAISIIYNKIIEEVAYFSVIKNYADSILLKTKNETADTYAQIEITDKISIKNSTTDLLTVLNGLIDVIKKLQTTMGYTFNPESKTALENYKTTIGTLLK